MGPNTKTTAIAAVLHADRPWADADPYPSFMEEMATAALEAKDGLGLLLAGDMVGSEMALSRALARVRPWLDSNLGHPDHEHWEMVAHHVSHPLGIMRLTLDKRYRASPDDFNLAWALEHLEAAVAEAGATSAGRLAADGRSSGDHEGAAA
jgi:hypothetical protein